MKDLPTIEQLSLILKCSVERFNNSIDKETLLRSDDDGLTYPVSHFRVAHEQAVSHRLAFYLECNLRDHGYVSDVGPLVVDCEYNQHLFDRKKILVLKQDAKPFIKAGREPRSVKGQSDSVEFDIRPDILLHRRGTDGPTNLMVLEVKKWTNPDKLHDELKLKLLTKLGLNSFGYVLGATVYARNDFYRDKRELQIGFCFHNGLSHHIS